MTEVLIPVLVLGIIAVLCAVLLTVSSAFFGVKDDGRATELRDCLPGANCGACGYSGCDGYAKALSEGKTDKTNLCTPGGDGVAKRLADIMGVEAGEVQELVAYVACNGARMPGEDKFIYDGPSTCKAANMSFAGDRYCTYACLGYGDCARVCPRDAICINQRGIAEIDPRKCIGCGLCTKICPHGIIRLVKDTVSVVVKCSNHSKGAEVRKYCVSGCIACRKCEKACPEGAITVKDNLAVIDYDKCKKCGICRKVCPTGVIHEGNFRCGSHFE